MSRRALLFIAIAALSLGGAGAYLLHAVRRTAPADTGPQAVAGSREETPRDAARVLAPGTAPPAAPVLIFVRTFPDQYNGALGVAPVADRTSPQFVPTLRCERVHMAAGKGVCLSAHRGVFTTYRAVLFDRDFSARGELPLAGVPSRVQVAPDGRLAAMTVFVTGHAYTGGFSTRTSIVDLATGKWLVEDLETFAVRRDGQLITSPDFNFWGVTFTPDGRRFYATLGTGGETLLVHGDVDARTIDVIGESVECPSLSPDGRRVAFKQRAGGVTGPVTWRLWVLDLETRRRHPLAETRSVDDQVQWLDDDRVLYALPGEEGQAALMNQWVVPADGGGEPQLYLPEAYSAAVVRGMS